jgi:hypothetical protein
MADPGRDVFAELFQVFGLRGAEFPDANAEVDPESWRGRLHQSLHEVYVEDGARPWDRADAIARYSFSADRLESAVEVLVLWEFDRLSLFHQSFGERWKGLAGEELLASAWRAFFRPVAAVEAEVERWLPSGPARVGVHVRATHEATAQKGAVSVERYFAAVDSVFTRIPGIEIVLATDNLDVESAFRGRYARVVTRPKWFARAGDPIHLAENDPDRWASTFAAAVELVALGRCEYLVTRRNSSYSILARVVSTSPRSQHIILDPLGVPRIQRIRGQLSSGLRWVIRRTLRNEQPEPS